MKPELFKDISKNLWKSVQGEPVCSMRTGRWRNMMKLVVAFCNFAKASKNYSIHAHYKLYCTAYDNALILVQEYTQPLQFIIRNKTH
jgi:hypothetical protein